MAADKFISLSVIITKNKAVFSMLHEFNIVYNLIISQPERENSTPLVRSKLNRCEGADLAFKHLNKRLYYEERAFKHSWKLVISCSALESSLNKQV